MKAIIVEDKGKAAVQDVSQFKSRPDYLRVKVKAVALNPTDWKHIDFIADNGAVVGCDFAGVVEEVGPDVKKSVKKGDRVCGFCHGSNISNHEDGAFVEECLVKDGMFMHIPDNMSFEEASSLPVGVGTTGQAMFQYLELPTPAEPKPKTPFPVLVYGGSTATGTIAIQFGVLSGLKVITTGSPKNHEMLEKLGAVKVFDYHDPECAAKIRDYTGNRLTKVFDTVAEKGSLELCANALSSDTKDGQPHYQGLLNFKEFPRDDVKAAYTMLYTASNEKYEKMGRTQEPKPEDHEYIRNWFTMSEKLLAEGKIKPHPIEVGKGFDGILNGLDRMRKGDYSAKKLVYTIA